MAETIFASMGEFGMSLSTITGAKGSLGNLTITGTQYATSNMESRRVEYNYKNLLVYSGTDHSRRRGLNLAIFDLNMNLVFMATYDVYGDANSRSNLSAKMKTITNSQLATLTSFDAIGSSTELDSTFDYFRSHAWPKTQYFDIGVAHKQTSYSAVICGKKKAIVAEKFVGRGVSAPIAEIEMAFEDPTTIGYSGFGKPVISDDEIHGNSGTSNVVKTWLDRTPLADLKLKVGDSYLFKSLGETDAIAAASETYLDYELIYLNSAGTEFKRESKRVKSVEGWEEIEIRGTIPTGCVYLVFRAMRKTTRDAPRSAQGTVYVKNTTMQVSDNDRVLSSQVSIGLYGTSVKSFSDSLGSFGHYDPEGYFQSAISESNIIRNTKITQQTLEPVRWMDRILDDDIERFVMKTTTENRANSVRFTLDPKKFYYVCVWVNKQYKSAGKVMLGLRQFSSTSSGTILPVKSTDGKVSSQYVYSQEPPFDTMEDRQWYLLQGFVLPHNIDQARANSFIEANKEFYGWDDIFGNGIGLSDNGNGEYGWISNSASTAGELQFIDYDNKGKESKTLWAMPIIRELSIGSVDVDDGVLTTINLEG